jgi:hypothetical protein
VAQWRSGPEKNFQTQSLADVSQQMKIFVTFFKGFDFAHMPSKNLAHKELPSWTCNRASWTTPS